jgi:hypothetical protein
MSSTPTTTVRDVTLDVVTALGMFKGTVGGDDTAIEWVVSGKSDRSVVLGLTNGDVYRLSVALTGKAQ